MAEICLGGGLIFMFLCVFVYVLCADARDRWMAYDQFYQDRMRNKNEQ